MKNLSLICLLGWILLSCEGPSGPIGPIGPRGPQGEPGGLVFSPVFEVEVDFNEANNFSALINFADEEIEVIEDDVTLVYLLWDVTEDTEGNAIPIWRQIPQTIFIEDGVFQYNFDFTLFDLNLFLDGPYDYALLGNEWTQNQLFRIVVIPGEYIAPNARFDFSDYEATIKLFGLDDSHVKRYQAK